MVRLAILTGLRVGEILALRWQDLNFDRGELRVEQAIYRGRLWSPKTKASKRTNLLLRHLRPAGKQIGTP